MSLSLSTSPVPKNEPVKEYRPDSPERKALVAELKRQESLEVDIPIVIDGKEIRTGQTDVCRMPHRHEKLLGKYHKAGAEEVRLAIKGSLRAWKEWSETSFEARASVFLKAADLLAGKYRQILNASTMLGQSKTCYQAEIDSACELIDFYRFNTHFMETLYRMQPLSAPGQWNRMEYRPLEGFVFAVTPFNFTSIAGNLPTTPALMGNVCLWKPASTSILSNYYLVKLLEEAGLPPGVIQFLPGSGKTLGDVALFDKYLAGVHFTGSTDVFQQIWGTVGENVRSYRNYPRLVGETGGKDFVFAHPSVDLNVLRVALVRGAYEFQGQKCSAASRAYIPKSVWAKLKEPLVEEIRSLKMGDVSDFKNFVGAVIDKNSFENIRSYIEGVKSSQNATILAGGNTNMEVGYFVEPTLIEAKDPKYRTMCEEIFGPVLTVYVYDDAKWEETLTLCDETSPYALTGAFLSQDRASIETALKRLRHSAGNFYINNKPTGAVVGQQPFGGGRASGTNDKAGSLFNLMRWTSVRTISETFEPPVKYSYPFME